MEGYVEGNQTMYGYMVEELVRTNPPEDTDTGGVDPSIQPIDWDSIWEDDIVEEWICDPLLPKGRLVALYADGKAGKSLLALEVAAALATGRHILDQQAGPPVTVLYIDQEMTHSDLIERLSDMGYGEESDMTRLRYYQMQSFPPFDTPQGADQLIALVKRDRPDLLVIDTVARVVAGAENDADTYRDLYRLALLPIKAMGVTVLRIDHAGKEATKGQRGSSAKNDDVDIVWRLEQDTQTNLKLVCDRRRVHWVPGTVYLDRTVNVQGHLHHYTPEVPLTQTQRDLVEQLDNHDVPVGLGRTLMRRRYDIEWRNADLGPAQKWRKGRRGTEAEPEPEARLPYKDSDDVAATELLPDNIA